MKFLQIDDWSTVFKGYVVSLKNVNILRGIRGVVTLYVSNKITDMS